MSFTDILKQMLTNVLLSLNISSAGGDSSKVNYVRYLDIDATEYEQVVQAEIQNAVDEAGGGGNRGPLRIKKPPKGMLFKILEQDLGLSKARQAAALLSNPSGVMSPILGGLLKGGGMMAAAVMAAFASYPVATFIAKQLTKRGSFFDLTFRNIMDNRVNVLRTRESQQEVRRGIEGKSQIILTTRAGTVDPIFSWNSYEQLNNNELEFEKLRVIRTVFTGP